MAFECPTCSQLDITLSVSTLVFCRNHFFLFFQACLKLSSSKKPSLVNCVHTLSAGFIGTSGPTSVLMQGAQGVHGGLRLS